jgi:gliding motility-associated protein GldM
MAGGKETPRQKMIGMMYLVLTALLALQVSNSVLEKFIFINQSLESSIRENTSKNSETINRIVSAVKDNGNTARDKAVLGKAQEVREETSKIIKELDDLKALFVQMTGGTDEKGIPVGVKDIDEVGNYMINKKNGYELQKTLNTYAKYLEEKTGQEVAPIALDAKDHPFFKNDANQKMKDFPTLTFEATPMAAGMASVSQLQTEVLQREAEALEELARQVGASKVSFSNIFPVVKPESRVVAAGTKYVAEMFIAASSEGITPKMMVDGKEIPVVDGKGKVEFVATPGSYVKGEAKKTFKAAITYPLGGGRDTTFVETVEYIVAEPVMQIQSASVSALYNNCGNELNVQVPALGATYNPTFSGSGAQFFPGQEKGFVTVVPSGTPEVTLNVASNGNPIGSQKFKVRPIPKPEIVAYGVGGKVLDEKRGEPTLPRQITVKANPDDGFKTFLPKDARYRVTEMEITLARGSRPVAPPMKVNNETVDLSNLVAQARPGDRLVIDIKRVERMNFKDQREVVNMGLQVKQVSINQ